MRTIYELNVIKGGRCCVLPAKALIAERDNEKS